MEKKKMIYSLQSWRAIMIIMVVFEHLSITNNLKYLSGGGEGVAYFILLSGFVTTITYMDKITDFSMKNRISFMKKKLMKFYPLHILALLASLLLCSLVILKNSTNIVVDLTTTIGKAIANALMIQAFIPIDGWYMNSINGVTWFLSATMFFYLITFSVVKMLKKIENKKSLQIGILAIILAIHTTMVGLLTGTKYATFVLYVFPVFRSLEFIAGAILGLIYKENTRRNNEYATSTIKWTGYEIAAVLLFVANHILLKTGYNSVATHFVRTCMFICSMVLVYVFAYEGGILSKILSNKYLVYIGMISFEVYIIHKVIIQYVTTVFGWNNLSAVISCVAIAICAPLANYIFTKKGKIFKK